MESKTKPSPQNRFSACGDAGGGASCGGSCGASWSGASCGSCGGGGAWLQGQRGRQRVPAYFTIPFHRKKSNAVLSASPNFNNWKM